MENRQNWIHQRSKVEHWRNELPQLQRRATAAAASDKQWKSARPVPRSLAPVSSFLFETLSSQNDDGCDSMESSETCFVFYSDSHSEDCIIVIIIVACHRHYRADRNEGNFTVVHLGVHAQANSQQKIETSFKSSKHWIQYRWIGQYGSTPHHADLQHDQVHRFPFLLHLSRRVRWVCVRKHANWLESRWKMKFQIEKWNCL